MTQLSFLVNYSTNVCFSNWEKGNISPTQKQKLFPDSTSSKTKSSAAFTGLQLHDATQFLGKLFNKCLLLKLRERKHFSHPEAKTFSRFDELKDCHRLLLRDCNYMTQLSFLVNYSTNVCFSNWEKGNVSPTQKQKLFPDLTSSKTKSSAAFTGLQLHDATHFLGKLFNKCLLLKLRERKHFSHPEAKTFSRFDELKD